MDISSIKENYFYAVEFIEDKIREELVEFGDDGIELIHHTEEEGYSLMKEIEPKVFKVVRKVRIHYDELQVIVEGEAEWSDIIGITDWAFFLNEVMCAIDAEYE